MKTRVKHLAIRIVIKVGVTNVCNQSSLITIDLYTLSNYKVSSQKCNSQVFGKDKLGTDLNTYENESA